MTQFSKWGKSIGIIGYSPLSDKQHRRSYRYSSLNFLAHLPQCYPPWRSRCGRLTTTHRPLNVRTSTGAAGVKRPPKVSTALSAYARARITCCLDPCSPCGAPSRPSLTQPECRGRCNSFVSKPKTKNASSDASFPTTSSTTSPRI